MSLRKLHDHVERAIAWSGNEITIRINILSSNQIKSGKLRIKTATSNNGM
jgi:hypothetical protein